MYVHIKKNTIKMEHANNLVFIVMEKKHALLLKGKLMQIKTEKILAEGLLTLDCPNTQCQAKLEKQVRLVNVLINNEEELYFHCTKCMEIFSKKFTLKDGQIEVIE
jgi:aspartate carbamoyltransferase regulatory subunit